MADESKSGALKISSPEELQNWLESLPPEQGRWVAVAIAARLALRVLPLVAKDAKHKRGFKNWTFGVFFATAFARVPAVHPTRSNELRAFDGYGYVNNPAEHDALAAEVHEAGSSTSVYEAALDAAVAAKVRRRRQTPMGTGLPYRLLGHRRPMGRLLRRHRRSRPGRPMGRRLARRQFHRFGRHGANARLPAALA